MKAYLKMVSWLAPLVLAFVLLSEYHKQIPPPFWVSLITYPLLPGYMVYILVTGDIHGWKPGPIGFDGRVAVVSISNTLIWALVVWFLTKRTRQATKKA